MLDWLTMFQEIVYIKHPTWSSHRPSPHMFRTVLPNQMDFYLLLIQIYEEHVNSNISDSDGNHFKLNLSFCIFFSSLAALFGTNIIRKKCKGLVYP